jgi:23S rRNA pseudouridine1911/1915/1917 synthase
VSAYNKPRGKAKESKLSYETLKQSAKYSLVEVDLFTGRPHQIRVQMAKVGHSLWGDYRYGEEGSKNGKEM